MTSLGTDLKSAREQKNIPLDQIATETKISLRHLRSLEQGDYKDLPGGMYNRAFLRTYCEYLSLDANSILDRYEAEVSPPPERVPKSRARPVQSSPSFRIHPLFAWSAMFVLSVIGLYFSRHWIAAVFSPYFSRPPASIIELGTNEVAQTQASPAETGVGSPQQGMPERQEGPPVELQEETPPTAPSSAAAALRLELQVTEKCWISVNDGTRTIEKMLEPGDDASFDAAEKLLIILGNAGGVRARINGLPAKPFGKAGQVVRLQIDGQNLRDLLETTRG